MLPPVHDDDTDYSDLDEEAPPAGSTSHGPRGLKNRERLSERTERTERTPLLSTSPPPPAYSDVTRLYGTPPYLTRNEQNSVQPEQTRHDGAVEPAHMRPDEPQSMGDPGRDAEDGSKPKRKRKVLNTKKALACLVFILAVSLVGLTAITTAKHDKSQDQNSGNNTDDSPSPIDGFPHLSRCDYQTISDRQTFSFQEPRTFSFVEITEGAHNPSSNINGQVRIMAGAGDQKDPILMEMRVAKSTEAQRLHFSVDYTAESLRLNTPTSSDSDQKACMELDISIWFRPGAQLEHLEIATEHLDVKIEPGLFPPSHDTFLSGQDQAYYISNTTDFIAVSGGLSAAYWESGRETRIDLISGSVSGRFALRDLLSVKTRSGAININVEPKLENPTDPQPASFVADTLSGSIKAIFPVSAAIEEIPPRLYHTKIESKSGSVKGNYIHGLNTDILTVSGSIDVNVLPYSANSTGSWLRTESTGGRIGVTVLPSYQDSQSVIGHLRSVHKTKSGSVHIKYPQQWEGKIEAVTMTGSVGLHGRDVEVLKRWSGPVGAHVVAKKGNATSAMDLGTTSGSVNAIIGDLH